MYLLPRDALCHRRLHSHVQHLRNLCGMHPSSTLTSLPISWLETLRYYRMTRRSLVPRNFLARRDTWAEHQNPENFQSIISTPSPSRRTMQIYDVLPAYDWSVSTSCIDFFPLIQKIVMKYARVTIVPDVTTGKTSFLRVSRVQKMRTEGVSLPLSGWNVRGPSSPTAERIHLRSPR